MPRGREPGAAGVPDVVVVGAAARDIDESDPRGWRLGGGVTYGALACARLGIRTGVLLGVDALATDAWELDLLVDAGVDIVRVPLPGGPVFDNQERPSGRIQIYLGPGTPMPVTGVPEAWRGAPTWLLAPVAGELSDEWAAQPAPNARVAYAWQGALRRLVAGERVTPLRPTPSAVLARADIVGVSIHDLGLDPVWADIFGWLRPTAELLLTAGARGGLLLRRSTAGHVTGRRFSAVPARVELDATGAGDCTLAALVCARIAGGLEAIRRGRDLHLAALTGSLIVEGPGIDAVPTLAAVRRRLEPRRDA
jgi:sugar/nucleoside kinase (ribokinase family)